MQDLALAFRAFRKRPAFMALTVAMMALGIGANTALFSFVHSVLLRPLPFKDPGRLTMISSRNLRVESPAGSVSFDDLADFREQHDVFESIAAATVQWSFNLSTDQGAEQVFGLWASQNFFSTLGIAPLAGRTFEPNEDRPGGPPVVVLSSEFARQQFGSEQASLRKTIRLDDREYSVVGVMPAHFVLIDSSSFWLPIEQNPFRGRGRGVRILNVFGRLKPGITTDRAAAAVQTIATRLEQQYPSTNKGISAEVQLLHQHITGSVRTPLLVLFGAVGLVLLIALTNVANLLLIRIADREHEVALRTALGASRSRILRQFLVESMVLSLAGAIGGTVLAAAGIPILLNLGPDLPRRSEIGINVVVLTFTVVLSVLAGVAFGLLPALHMRKLNINDRLKATGRTLVSKAGRHRMRAGLVISEVGLAVVLLVGAGLLIRSFIRLTDVDPGYRTDHLVLVNIDLPRSSYPQPSDRLALYFRIEDELKRLPGVRSVGAVSRLPLSSVIGTNNVTTRLEIEGRPAAAGEEAEVDYRIASSDYFEAMRIPVLRGRRFTRQDSTAVAIVNEAMAKKFWPQADPIGKRIAFGNPAPAPWVTIIGIVGDVRHLGLDVKPRPEVYRPYANNPLSGPMIAVHTAIDPQTVIPSIRPAIRSVAIDVPIQVNPFAHLVELSTASRRFSLWLLATFAGVSMLLAAVGIYGVLSYSVLQRTHEIGLRIALGAQTSQILAAILREGFILAAAGVAAGIVGAVAVTRLMKSMLFETDASDPMTLVAVSLTVIAVALAACYMPARRAANVHPDIALRFE